MAVLRQAFEKTGVEFIDENGGGGRGAAQEAFRKTKVIRKANVLGHNAWAQVKPPKLQSRRSLKPTPKSRAKPIEILAKAADILQR